MLNFIIHNISLFFAYKYINTYICIYFFSIIIYLVILMKLLKKRLISNKIKEV